MPESAGAVRWRDEGAIPWLEADLDGAKVCFTSRKGGISEGPFCSLNLGILTEDDPAVVRRNRHMTAAAVGIEASRVAMGRQVHGADLAYQDGTDLPPHFAAPGEPPEEADGQVSDRKDIGLLVLVADCYPVALRGPGGLAMLHCGWRGLAAGIIGRGAETISADSAVVGPGIGPCCFEVGPEVFEAFSSLGPGVGDGRMCDLPEVIRRLLHQAGVERISESGICTSCERETYFSHRRDSGVTGRQAGIAWLT
jgi:purine-nucleoside/S-methyl-5'-thioadenosine phosphorylase / adenosine deaminase